MTNLTLVNTTHAGVTPTEADVVTLTGTYVDPGTGSPQNVVIDWGDGFSSSVAIAGYAPQTFTATHQYLDANYHDLQGHFTVRATVTDDSNATGVLSTPSPVTNDVPRINPLVLDRTVMSEGDVIGVTGSFADLGTLNPHTVLVNWGDGTTGFATLDNVAQTFSASHKYIDANYNGQRSQFTITATVTDDSNAATSTASRITVNNVAPLITQYGLQSATVTEGDLVVFSATFVDPGTGDPHSAVIDWGDGFSSVATIDTVSQTLTATHHYLDSNYAGRHGQFTITATVTDDSGATSTITTPIAVRDAPPVVTMLSADTATIAFGDTVVLSGRFVDPGTLGSHTAMINWGDGAFSEAVLDNVAETFTARHTYSAAGGGTSVAITATVTDGSGTTGAKTIDVAFLIPPPPQQPVADAGAGLQPMTIGAVDLSTFGVIRTSRPLIAGDAEAHAQLTALPVITAGTAVNNATFTVDFGVATDLQTGDAVIYTVGDGTPISGLEAGGTYYVISITPTSIQLAPTYSDAVDGNAIQIQSDGATGTQHQFTIQTGIKSATLAPAAAATLAQRDGAAEPVADETELQPEPQPEQRTRRAARDAGAADPADNPSAIVFEPMNPARRMALLQGDQIRIPMQARPTVGPAAAWLFDEAAGTLTAHLPPSGASGRGVMVDDLGEEWLYIGAGALQAATAPGQA
jgi:hypothetical protein